MGAVAALEWNQSGGHVDEVVALVARRAGAAGELSARDPNLLTLAALLPMIVGDRDEALRIFDLAMVDAHRRGSLFAITGMYLWRGFTLFWRGDLIDAEEELRAAFDQAETWGYGPDTLQWNAAHLSWCLTERGNLAGARQALAARPRARRRAPTARATGATRGSSCWSPRAATRTPSRPARSTGAASPATTTRRPRAGARCARSRSTRSGMKRKAIELAAEELDRARDWGAPGTVARSLRVLGTARGRRRASSASRRRSRSSRRAPSRLELAKSLAALGVTAPPRGPPGLRARAADARARAGRGLRRRAPARADPHRDARGRRRAGVRDAARRGVADRDRAARRRARRRGPRRARDRAGAVRHPADDRDQARQRAAQARSELARASSRSRWKPDGNPAATLGARLVRERAGHDDDRSRSRRTVRPPRPLRRRRRLSRRRRLRRRAQGLQPRRRPASRRRRLPGGRERGRRRRARRPRGRPARRPAVHGPQRGPARLARPTRCC